MVESLDKKIAASGIEPWSETDSDIAEDSQQESDEDQSSYLIVRQDAGIGAHGTIPTKNSSTTTGFVKMSLEARSEIISNQLKSILVVKTYNPLTHHYNEKKSKEEIVI